MILKMTHLSSHLWRDGLSVIVLLMMERGDKDDIKDDTFIQPPLA